MGITTLIRKPVASPELNSSLPVASKPLILLIKGYLINIANPLSLVFWIGIVGFAGKTWGMHSQDFFLLFAGVFFTAFSTDLLKCYLSGLLRKVLVSGAIFWINRVMGLVFMGIGCYVIYSVR